MDSQRNWIKDPGLWLVFTLYLALGLYSFNRGLFLADEGYQVYFGSILARGAKVYKDFHVNTAPLSLLLYALLTRIFGLKIIVYKTFELLLATAGFFAVASLSRKIVPAKYWLLGSALYIVYSNNLYTFMIFTMEARNFLLLALALMVAWRESGDRRALFAAGFFASMAGFSNQSFGAIALVMAAAFLFFRDQKTSPGRLKPPAFFAAGFLVPALAIGVYLARERLIEEFVRTMLVSGPSSKQHVYHVLLTAIIPACAAASLVVLAGSRLWGLGRKAEAVALSLVAGIAALVFLSLKNPALIPHLVSLLIPVGVLTLSGNGLAREKSPAGYWLIWSACVLIFAVGLLSGYDLAHNLQYGVFILPWIARIIARWQDAPGRKIFRLRPAALASLALLFAAGAYLVASRREFYGRVEPLWKCNSRLEIPAARGIYTSRGQKQELEALVQKIDQLCRPNEKILVYPNQMMIYSLAGRDSLAKMPYFYYELVEIQDLEAAAKKALASKSLVVFELEGGKIRQPIIGPQAARIVDRLSNACVEKIWLTNYLVCPLGE